MVLALSVLCATVVFVVVMASTGTKGKKAAQAEAALKPTREPDRVSFERERIVQRDRQPTLSQAAQVAGRLLDDMTFDVVYRDGDGDITARRIEIATVSRNYDSIYIDAWCHLRRADRTFRADRIVEIASALTGELLVPPTEGLLQYVREKTDPGPGFKSAITRARKGLLSLIWLARADHDVSQEEAEIMLGYIKDRALLGGRSSGDLKWSDWAARQWIDAQRPTLEEALGAKITMAHRGEEEALCAAYAAKILAAQPDAVRQKVASRVTRLGLILPAAP